MTKEGIKKFARLNKKAQNSIFSALGDLGTLALCTIAALVAGGGFASGVLYSRATAPRQSDAQNVTRQYQVQRLKNDVKKQQALLNRQKYIYDDKEQPKKSVYGIV